MQTSEQVYTYEFITKEQSGLINQAADCLTQSFIGIDVDGKWVQEPMVGNLSIQYDDFYNFTKEYIEGVVDQGYSIVARDHNGEVVGVLVGDVNAPEIIGEDVFEGSFSDMNVILHVLEDVDKRFLEDYKKRMGKELQNGEMLHLFMIGITAKEARHEAIEKLGVELIHKAKQDGLKAVYGEATNPKSIRIAQKYYGQEKYLDVDGNPIVHKYHDNENLKDIPESIADGTYLIIREL